MEEEKVILVDADDNEIGEMPKQECHVKGLLHRAFSVFVFNTAGELLLQRRAMTKYHSPGLWTNTCCSHPRKGETTLNAAKRRLMEEMGVECELVEITHFTYKADVMCGLTEHEIDHVFVGCTDRKPVIDKSEVDSWKYVSAEFLRKDVSENPQNYTEWFKIILDNVMKMTDMLK